MGMAPKSSRRRLAVTAMLTVATIAALLSSCSGVSAKASNAPVLHVVTALYPLAVAATEIGQTKVDVVDVVPDGMDPRTYRPTSEDTANIGSAGLILEVGGGFQPLFERAAAASSHVVSLGGATPDGQYAWLDPTSMSTYVGHIEAAMVAADPDAKSLFSAGADAFRAETDSTAIDYQNTLSLCPHTTMFTVDSSFASVAKTSGLHDVPLGTTQLGSQAVASFADQVRSAGVAEIFAQTWEDDAAVEQVASEAGVGVRSLDTLLGSPPAGWPPHASYIQLLEANLGAINRGLTCGGELPSS
jgi:zinc transport system substrate-binding protein